SICKNEFYLRAIEPFLHQHHISIAGICKRPEFAIDHFINAKADLIVMDANWFDYPVSGADILKQLLHFDQNIKVIMVTNCSKEKLAVRVQHLGAKGYFSRMTNNIKHIAQCIKRVH